MTGWELTALVVVFAIVGLTIASVAEDITSAWRDIQTARATAKEIEESGEE